jgi:hypothetical protein
VAMATMAGVESDDCTLEAVLVSVAGVVSVGSEGEVVGVDCRGEEFLVRVEGAAVLWNGMVCGG